MGQFKVFEELSVVCEIRKWEVPGVDWSIWAQAIFHVAVLLKVIRKGAANNVNCLLGEEVASEEKLPAVFL